MKIYAAGINGSWTDGDEYSETDAFSDKVLATLRQEFGGHAVLKVG